VALCLPEGRVWFGALLRESLSVWRAVPGSRFQYSGLLREHGQLRKDAKAAIHGRSARAVPGAGRFAPLTVFPALQVRVRLSDLSCALL